MSEAAAITAEEVADAALAWIYCCGSEAQPFRDICKRLGGRFLDEVNNFDRDDHKCLHCGATEKLEIDHVIPWSKGGCTKLDNLQTLCRTCNRRKGAR